MCRLSLPFPSCGLQGNGRTSWWLLRCHKMFRNRWHHSLCNFLSKKWDIGSFANVGGPCSPLAPHDSKMPFNAGLPEMRSESLTLTILFTKINGKIVQITQFCVELHLKCIYLNTFKNEAFVAVYVCFNGRKFYVVYHVEKCSFILTSEML